MFRVTPERLDAWRERDHERWAVSESRAWLGLIRKEVRVNSLVPGEVYCVRYWRVLALWRVIDEQWLAENKSRFAARFGPAGNRLVQANHEHGGCATRSASTPCPRRQDRGNAQACREARLS